MIIPSENAQNDPVVHADHPPRGTAVFRGDQPCVTINEVKLRQLLTVYEGVKQAADDATERLKEVTDGIKANAQALYPGYSAMVLVSGVPGAPPLMLNQQISNRIDTAKVKSMLTAEQYRALTKQSVSWVLKADKS